MTANEGTSERASRISRVVDEIVFQTDILALNAALEEASAGEAGRGLLEGAVTDTWILVAASMGRSPSAAGFLPGAGQDGAGGRFHGTESGD